MASVELSPDKKYKIVIIEGDSAFGDHLTNDLSKKGYIVKLIKDGNDGLKGLYDDLPHLILLDVVLPGTNGYEILAKIQEEPLLKSIPLFLLSTQGVPINMMQVPQNSVKDFILTFHSDTEEIIKKIDHHFGIDDQQEDSKPMSILARKKILWIEDDKLISAILEKKITGAGFELVRAKNAEDASQVLSEMTPNAIVLDLLLPGVSGFDILEKISKDQKLKNIPIMIFSNLSKQADVDRARALGVKKFLVKAATSLDQIVAEIKDLSK
jgi:DNA-binding response OmpR family regulator